LFKEYREWSGLLSKEREREREREGVCVGDVTLLNQQSILNCLWKEWQPFILERFGPELGPMRMINQEEEHVCLAQLSHLDIKRCGNERPGVNLS